MRVRNVHERRFTAPAEQVASLLDGLSSPADRLWPSGRWPAMRLDGPLRVGACGGHGPVRYRVEKYEPGSRVHFRFHAPRGFDGLHWLEILPAGTDATTLRHVLEMHARGPALITWPVAFRPLHDALVEDCLDTAARALGEHPGPRKWSLWVRTLRRVFQTMQRRRARGAPHR